MTASAYSHRRADHRLARQITQVDAILTVPVDEPTARRPQTARGRSQVFSRSIRGGAQAKHRSRRPSSPGKQLLVQVGAAGLRVIWSEMSVLRVRKPITDRADRPENRAHQAKPQHCVCARMKSCACRLASSTCRCGLIEKTASLARRAWRACVWCARGGTALRQARFKRLDGAL